MHSVTSEKATVFPVFLQSRIVIDILRELRLPCEPSCGRRTSTCEHTDAPSLYTPGSGVRPGLGTVYFQYVFTVIKTVNPTPLFTAA